MLSNIEVIRDDEQSIGYKWFEILLSSKDFEDPLPTLGLYFDEILSKFYHLAYVRSKLIDNAVLIINQTQRLVQDDEDKDVIKKLLKASKQRNIISNIHRMILDDRLHRIEPQSFIAEDTRSRTSKGVHALQYALDAKIEDMPVLPLDEVKQILTVKEDRRQKSSSNAISVVGALTGAIVGALITFFLTTYQDPHFAHGVAKPLHVPTASQASPTDP